MSDLYYKPPKREEDKPACHLVPAGLVEEAAVVGYDTMREMHGLMVWEKQSEEIRDQWRSIARAVIATAITQIGREGWLVRRPKKSPADGPAVGDVGEKWNC